MHYLFYLGHPAHFHLFKNIAFQLVNKNHQVIFIIKKKDILEELVSEAGFKYKNILPEGRKDSKFQIALGLIKRDFRLFLHCLKKRPDMLIGTSTEITHVGLLLRIPSMVVNEDDYDAVKLFSKLGYPYASVIVAPKSCPTGKPDSSWEKKTIHYNGYHELAYLHPNNFVPNKILVENILNTTQPYFIIRFAKLTAHHDVGKKGISDDLARSIIKKLKPHGKVFITSERAFSSDLEDYRIRIDASKMHDVLAFAQMYIGDSQTMAAEAAVLGTPSIRFNDFVGKLGYLEELEKNYGLTFGIPTSEPENLFNKIDEILNIHNIREIWAKKRELMLNEKIDVASYMSWLIENYPDSKQIMKQNPEYQYNFK